MGLLHDLGVVIRFPGDTQVLNPRWVTQGVYGLLTSAELVKSQGQFDLQDIGPILARLPEGAARYPAHTHQRLIGVMKEFELCFEFTDRPGHYLIPRHLHDNELDIPWDDADALRFQYHYETLPDSVISRFITRMNQYIQRQYYWKNGVFLQNGENRARVKADLVDRKIFLSVIGKEAMRRAFLAILRSSLDEINSSYKINIEQMVPLPASPEVLVSYKELLVHEEMGEAEIIVPALRQKFSVRTLLEGVEDPRERLERQERAEGDERPLLRVQRKISPPRRTQAPPIPPPEPEVFVSYAWNPESNRIVDKIQEAFGAHGIRLLRDKEEVRYKDSIRSFMERIGQGKAIVVVISEKYLKSENCMFEMLEIAKAESLRERIFPVVLADANIYKATGRVRYVQHWESEVKELDEALKTVRGDNLANMQADLTLYSEIRRLFDRITDTLKDMNALTPDEHEGADFEQLIRRIRMQLGV